MSAGDGETYLRLLAEAELRQAPVLAGPGPHIHRMWLAATALAAARAVGPGAAWQVLADFEAAAALRTGDGRAILRGARAPHWARPPGTGQPAVGGQLPAPTAIPIGATLPLPPEREGWYGELRLLCLARTDSQAAITVATRWVGQARRSAAPRPRHAPFHQVGALDDSGTSCPGALWDMGIEDGREWWDCHLGLTPALPAGTRWLEVGPGAGGRCVRVDLAPAGTSPVQVSVAPAEPASPAARLLDRAGEELLCHGPASIVGGLPLGPRVALLIQDLTGSGALPADDPAVRRLAALGWRLGLDLGAGSYRDGPGSSRAPAGRLPAAWASLLIDGDTRDGPDGVAPFAASLPEIDGARLALAGLRSARDGVTLHIMTSGWEPLGLGWLVHGTPSGSEPPDVSLSWQARDSAGRWHLVRGTNWGSRQGMIQMHLTPPLHPAARSLEVIITGTRREIRAAVPLDWMDGGPQ